uniref:AAA_28 domain-containing protein n=1 Tax=Steinernema glaseri TaxID=37863 RepID=A0A1I8A322_9BILA
MISNDRDAFLVSSSPSFQIVKFIPQSLFSWSFASSSSNSIRTIECTCADVISQLREAPATAFHKPLSFPPEAPSASHSSCDSFSEDIRFLSTSSASPSSGSPLRKTHPSAMDLTVAKTFAPSNPIPSPPTSASDDDEPPSRQLRSSCCSSTVKSSSDYFSGDDLSAPESGHCSPSSTPPVSETPLSLLQRLRLSRLSTIDLLASTTAELGKHNNRVFHMAEPETTKPLPPRVYKLVLTGGPCGGKTTGQDRLASFFESMGWKVFTVPEAATVLLGGGVKFGELNAKQAYEFQKDLLLTLLRLEDVFFNQATMVEDKNVLIICDRGAMDPSAYIDSESWNKMLDECGLNQFELRENRYNQIVHMVTAADGAESYYTVANNKARKEGLTQALDQDRITRNAWVGHPYVDIIDNTDCDGFDDKILNLISVVCDRVGLPYQDRLAKNSRKRKWLVRKCDDSQFPKYEEFRVVHDYLHSDTPHMQVRIRQRCQNGRSTYTITTRDSTGPEPVETRMSISQRDYLLYKELSDNNRVSLHKSRRCFNYGRQYFHLDTYVDPLPPACGEHQLMILETYTTSPRNSEAPALPDFIEVVGEITGKSQYSMYNLAKIGCEPLPFHEELNNNHSIEEKN